MEYVAKTRFLIWVLLNAIQKQMPEGEVLAVLPLDFVEILLTTVIAQDALITGVCYFSISPLK